MAKLAVDQALLKAKSHAKKGDIEEAQKLYKKVLQAFPKNKRAQKGLDALKKLKKSTAYQTPPQEISNQLSNLYNQGQLKAVVEQANLLTALYPEALFVWNMLGIATAQTGQIDKAITAFQRVIAIKPDYPDAYNNMGNALREQGKSEEAIASYNKALSLKPDYAAVYNNMGTTLRDQGKFEEATAYYNKALSLKPDFAEAHENLSFVLLNSGRLQEGLDKYEWRWKSTAKHSSKRNFPQPLWDPQHSLQGKRILLWCEQGVGDTINWSSKLPLIFSQADHCILECQEKLVPLLTRSFPNIEIKAEDRSRDSQRDDFDFHLPMGSIYRHFISEISAKSMSDPFLVPDPVRIKFWRQRLKYLGKGPYIGISWKSSNLSPRRIPNYAPISDWSPIFLVPDVTFVNLQYIDFLYDLSKIQDEFGVTIHNFDDLDHYNDLDDVAALCAALDMVVSTKITVPFISAGVGTLTKLANWRQSPWNNVLLNPVGPAIDIFDRNTWEPWKNIFSAISKDIINFRTKSKTD